MKKILLAIIFFMTCFSLEAQEAKQESKENSVFHTYLYNEEYKVYMELDLNGAGVSVPGQEIFGKVPGYFGATRDSRKWLITSCDISGKNIEKIGIVNDYGSEDLTATLIYNPQNKTYTLKQQSGSKLKIVVNRKWVKIPQEIIFEPHERVADEW